MQVSKTSPNEIADHIPPVLEPTQPENINDIVQNHLGLVAPVSSTLILENITVIREPSKENLEDENNLNEEDVFYDSEENAFDPNELPQQEIPAEVPETLNIDVKPKGVIDAREKIQNSLSFWSIAKNLALNILSEGAKKATNQVLKHVTENYSKNTPKKELIDQAKQTILRTLDAKFLSLSELVTHLAWSAIQSKISTNKQDFISQSLQQNENFIHDVIEVNLAQGFARLAKKINRQRDTIPNSAQQSSLVNAIAFLVKVSSGHIDAKQLKNIDQDYRAEYDRIISFAKSNFPNQPYQALIKEYIQNPDPDSRQKIIDILLPNYVKGQYQMEDLFLERINGIDDKHKKAIKAVFEKVTDAILSELFPNKVKDLTIPCSFLTKIPGLENLAYGWLKDLLTDLLTTLYSSIENNTLRNEAWESSLKNLMGIRDLSPIIQSPSALLLGFSKNFIQTNPDAVKIFANLLDSLFKYPKNEPIENPQQNPNNADKSENSKKAELVSQLSQQQLANWIVESIQSILHTQDPHLLGLGEFVNQVFNNLTLALLATGTDYVFEKNETINKDHFLKEFLDRIMQKMKTAANDLDKTKQFWNEFVDRLPLPEFAKSSLAALLIEKTESSLATYVDNNFLLGEVKNPERDTKKIIETYRHGEEILSVIETISNQLINSILEENIGLVENSDLRNKISELADEFLPGVQINHDLKNWLKSNISAFVSNEEGNSPEAIRALKRGINEILREGLITTVETNFGNDSDACIAQLFDNIHNAFRNVFSEENIHLKNKISAGQKIQARIRKKQAYIQQLKKQPIPIPENLTKKQSETLENLKTARLRYQRSENYLSELHTKLSKTLEDFDNLNMASLTMDHLDYVHQAIVIHQAQMENLRTDHQKNLFIEKLQLENANLKNDNVPGSQAKYAVNQNLISLIGMSSMQLALVAQVLHLDATIKHAEQELNNLSLPLKELNHQLETLDRQEMDNRFHWKKAKEAYVAEHFRRQTIAEVTLEIESLEKTLDPYIAEFQQLADQLSALLGLDQKEKLKLNPLLRDHIWPHVESFKRNQFAKILFTHITPLLLPIYDIEMNREKLKELSQGDDLLGQLSATVAQEIIGRIPDFVTSYRPFAKKIVEIMDGPIDDDAVNQMEVGLQKLLIFLGKEAKEGKDRVTASMLKPKLLHFKEISSAEDEAKIEAISQAFAEEVNHQEFKEFTLQQVVTQLEIFKKDDTAKEALRLAKLAQALTKNLNQFLLDRGKNNLTPEKLILAYHAQFNGAQAALPDNLFNEKLEAIRKASLVKKIRDVAITPEEIAQELNDAIPGAKDLHTLIAPELQAAIIGQHPAFEANRGTMQRYAEGMLLRMFLLVGQANKVDGQDIVTTITNKLKNLEFNARDLEKTDEEIARTMIDHVISNILGVDHPDVFKGIPLPLQQLVFEKITEVAYKHATPILLPSIERYRNRANLKVLSGSNFLGNLSRAISQDIFKFIPIAISSYKKIVRETYEIFYDQDASVEQVEQMATEIAALVKNSNNSKLTNRTLLEVFIKGKELDEGQKAALAERLRNHGVKQTIKSVVITPEEIIALIKKDLLPQMPAALQARLEKEIQVFIHQKTNAYNNIVEFAEGFVDGILLNVFTQVAKKNPPSGENDSLLIATQKMLNLIENKLRLLEVQPFHELAIDMENEVMKSIFGIDSPEAFKGLPSAIQTELFEVLKGQLAGRLIDLQLSVKNLEDPSVPAQAAKTGLRDIKFKVDQNADHYDPNLVSNGEILAHDLSYFILAMLPETFIDQFGNGKDVKIVNAISRGIEDSLEELKRDKWSFSETLLKYVKAPQYQKLLSENLIKIAHLNYPFKDNQKAVELLTNLISIPLNRMLHDAVALEEKSGDQFTLNLTKEFLEVLYSHFQALNAAKALAKADKRTEMKHSDFIAIQGNHVHPAVPKGEIKYTRTIDFIVSKLNVAEWNEAQMSNLRNLLRTTIQTVVDTEDKGEKNLDLTVLLTEINAAYKTYAGVDLDGPIFKALLKQDEKGFNLKSLIREEGKEINSQRLNEANKSNARKLLKAVLPNGKDDLIFLPKESRPIVWKLLKSVLPTILPTVLDQIFNPKTINKIVVKICEQGIEKLNERIPRGIRKNQPPKGPLAPLNEFDHLLGNIMVELMKNIELPKIVKNRLVNPKTGASESIKRSLGAALREELNGTFVRTIIPQVLEGIVKRDNQGDFAFKFDDRPKPVKDAEEVQKSQRYPAEIPGLVKKLIESGISYYIRKEWVGLQEKIDEKIDSTFGRIGSGLKKALDMVFRFIFIKMLGALLRPLQSLILAILYRAGSFDKNVNSVLDLFRQVPSDQPGKEEHGLYNDDLVYKTADALYAAL